MPDLRCIKRDLMAKLIWCASPECSRSTEWSSHQCNWLTCPVIDAEMARIATRLLMLCDALDKVVQDQVAMDAAGQEFKNLLDSVSRHFHI